MTSNHSPGRLSLASLGQASTQQGVTGPAVDPRSLDIGIVHLGVGAFHRAHQAVYTEDAAAAAEDTRWGILGVTGRSRKVADQLQPQDGLYSVLTRSAASRSLRIIGSMRSVASPDTDTGLVLKTLAAPTTSIVSLTITEKGYPRTPSGHLDLANEAVAADARSLRSELRQKIDGGPARSAVGLLTRGLGRRFAESQQPLTVLPCDNLTANGALTRRLVIGLAEAAGEAGLVEWIESSVAFPSTMVDRIVPVTTDEDRLEVRAMLGMQDQGVVVAEPFGQWVIEDTFAGPRPAWDRAGATLAADIEPYEVAKLRMLNATHSLLAYLGALKGFATIAEAVSDPGLAGAARRLQNDDVIPTLSPPPGLDLAAYGESILSRFANPALGHTTIQVAMDGSQKLPIRVLGTVSDRLKDGAVPHGAALLLAAWMVFIHRGHDVNGRPLVLDDPLAAQLHEAARGTEAGLADRMLALRSIFPEHLAGHDEFSSAVRHQVAALLKEIA